MKQSHIIINEITHELRMTIPELADNIGVSQSSIYAIAQGKTKRISPTLAGRIIDKYPQFSRRYLLTGEGSIYTDPAIDTSQLSPDVLTIIAKKDEQIDRLLSIIEAMQR